MIEEMGEPVTANVGFEIGGCGVEIVCGVAFGELVVFVASRRVGWTREDIRAWEYDYAFSGVAFKLIL